jgi:hypothetical protein
MSRKIINSLIVLLISIAGALTSCTYDWIEYPVPPPVDTTVVISFSADVTPIWNDGGNCTSCHKTGGQAPNLETDKAYNSINSLGLVDLTNPSSSIIYYYPEASTNSHKWKKYDATQAQTILTWIQQGGKNN